MSAFDAAFGAVLLVNLDRRTDRLEQANAELSRCGIDSCVRFPALEGPDEYPYYRAPMGCMRSHRAIWRRLAAGEYGESVAIFEDDFQLLTERDLIEAGYSPDSPTMRTFHSVPGESFAERFAAMQPEIPAEWDLLYFGGGYARAPLARVSQHVVRNAGMLCTHAYAISRGFAAWLTTKLDASHPMDSVHSEYPGAADSILSMYVAAHHDIRSYTFQPRLFIQRPGTRSDITGEVPNFPHHLVDAAHERMV